MEKCTECNGTGVYNSGFTIEGCQTCDSTGETTASLPHIGMGGHNNEVIIEPDSRIFVSIKGEWFLARVTSISHDARGMIIQHDAPERARKV